MANKRKQHVKRENQTNELLQYLVAIELAQLGVTQGNIARRLGVGKATINKILKGIDIDRPRE